MSVNFDKDVLKRITDEKFNNDEAFLLLNNAIDSELEKESPNFDYIDECTEALIKLQNGDFKEEKIEVKPFKGYNEEGSAKRIKLSKALVRTLLIAAVILATTITANATYTSVTGKNLFDVIVNTADGQKKPASEEASKETKQSTTKRKTSSTENDYHSSKRNTTTEKKTETTTEREEKVTEHTHIEGAIGETIPKDDETTLPPVINDETQPEEPEATVPDTTQQIIEGEISPEG